MFDYKKLLVITNIVLIIMVFISGIFIIHKNQDIKTLEAQVEVTHQKIESYSGEIEKINKYKKSIETLSSELEKTINEKEKLKKSLDQLKEDLNIQDMSRESIKKSADIAQNTPLTLKTSIILVKTANQFDLKPSLILSIMELESNFEKYQVGADQDRGYMQIIPSTEKWLANEFKEMHQLEYNPSRIFEPEYNIKLAATYLRILKDAYGEDYNRILSEYNRGPYNLAKYYEEHKTYSTSYSRVILNKENKYLAYNE